MKAIDVHVHPSTAPFGYERKWGKDVAQFMPKYYRMEERIRTDEEMAQEFFPNERRFYPLYETCQELNVPVSFHTGTTGLGAGMPGCFMTEPYPSRLRATFWPRHLKSLSLSRLPNRHLATLNFDKEESKNV